MTWAAGLLAHINHGPSARSSIERPVDSAVAYGNLIDIVGTASSCDGPIKAYWTAPGLISTTPGPVTKMLWPKVIETANPVNETPNPVAPKALNPIFCPADKSDNWFKCCREDRFDVEHKGAFYIMTICAS